MMQRSLARGVYHVRVGKPSTSSMQNQARNAKRDAHRYDESNRTNREPTCSDEFQHLFQRQLPVLVVPGNADWSWSVVDFMRRTDVGDQNRFQSLGVAPIDRILHGLWMTVPTRSVPFCANDARSDDYVFAWPILPTQIKIVLVGIDSR